MQIQPIRILLSPLLPLISPMLTCRMLLSSPPPTFLCGAARSRPYWMIIASPDISTAPSQFHLKQSPQLKLSPSTLRTQHIRGSISVIIQPILATTNTSAEIWEKLSSTYAKPTRGHIQQLRQQSSCGRKGRSWLMNTYKDSLLGLIIWLFLVSRLI